MKKKEFKKRMIMGISFMMMVFSIFFSTVVLAANEGAAIAATPDIGVTYRGHIENQGDMPKPVGTMIAGPNALGTRGQSLRVEGFWIELTGTDLPANAAISYQVHVQNEGWMATTGDGKFAGTQGKSQRIEAIKINLINMPGYDVYYRGHVQNVGDIPQTAGSWGWVKNGAELGTTGSSLRLEELQVKIVKQESAALSDTVYKKAGTYGPKTGSVTIDNNVIIDKSGVTLQNTVINGDLTIGAGVGNGDVVLNNVTVKGTTYVKGGGKDSIHINGGDYKQVVMMRTESGQTRIVATDANNIEVVISEDATGEDIILEGAFDKVTVDAPNVVVNTQGDTKIAKLDVGKEATGSDIKLAKGTAVADLAVSAPVKMTGEGTIEKADVHSDGVSFETAPVKQNVDPEVKTPPVITPPVVDPVKPPVPPTPDPPGGGGGTPTTIPLSYLGLTGNGNVGDDMGAILRPSDATCTYQWYRSPEENGGGTFTAIPGATGKTYKLQLVDVGCSIRVSVTGTGIYTGTLTSIAFDQVTNLIDLTDGGHMSDITINTDEHITSFDKLIASKKLPPEFTVTDGVRTLIAPITRWYDGVNSKPVFDGSIGDKVYYTEWECPAGYRATIEDIAPQLVIHTTVTQTPYISSEKDIIEAHIGTLSGDKVIDIPENTDISNLIAATSISPYARIDILDGNNQVIPIDVHTTTMVANGMKIRITAEDGSTATYGVQLLDNQPVVGTVSNLQLIPNCGDIHIKFDQPASMIGVKGFDIYLTTDGMNWTHKQSVPIADGYDSDKLFISAAVVASMLDTTTDFTQVKVVTLADTGYSNGEVIFPLAFKITKDVRTVSVEAQRSADGAVFVTLPEDKAADQTYLYQLIDANQNLRMSSLISANEELLWQDPRTFTIASSIVESTDAAIRIMRVTNGSTTGITATTLADNSINEYSIDTRQKLVVPTNLTVTTGDRQAVLNWNASANATNYSVYVRNTTSEIPCEVASGITGTTYTATGLTPGQTYYYTVKASAENYITSLASNEASVIANVTLTGNSLSGNRLIVINSSLEAGTAQNTGVIGNVVAPSAEMLVSDVPGESFQLNPEIPFEGGAVEGSVNASIEPILTSSEVGDTRNFFTHNYVTQGSDITLGRCAYIGSNVEVWVEAAGNPVQLDNTDAAALGTEFDANIYDLVTSKFYTASDVDNNSKIIILCYDIKDGFSGSGGFVGGFYDPNDTVAGPTSNNGEVLYIDTDPAIGVAKDMTRAKSTMVHEFQHLVNFNCNKNQGGQMATWLNEALSMAAEHLYEGVQSERVSYYSSSDAIAAGRSVFDWSNTDVLSSYAQSYVFAAYLSSQASLAKGGGQTDIFAKIITDPGDEITALTNTIHSEISPDYGLIEMLPDFRVATVLKAPVGKYGFGAESAVFTDLVPKVSNATNASLAGGGALIKNITGNTFSVPETHGADMRYISVY